jgi:NAD(P)-dependent dehydrogenase (short-subunit alcohol dehydrogenase family)
MSDVVVITGASGGIGRATARRFARDGAKIALLARGNAGLEAAAREIEERGGKALVLPTDVADAEQVEAAAQAAESELGPIDIWVNDAMATIYAFRGIPLQAPYCGAKHACKGFTESVITEIRHNGWDIHVTMVHLAGFNTTQFTWGRTKLPKQTQPVPPIYQPEIAADAIHWAAYHRRRQVYVGLPTVLNILGERVAPWFLDWYLAKTGYGSQMTKQPLDGGANHDNLFHPVDGDEDRGSHGPFDEKAHAHSFQTSLTKHRRLAGSLAAGVGAAATGAALLRKR